MISNCFLFLIFFCAITYSPCLCQENFYPHFVEKNGEMIKVTPENERQLLYDTTGFRKAVSNKSITEDQVFKLFERYKWSSFGAGANFAPWKEKWLGPKGAYESLVSYLLNSPNTHQALIGVHLAVVSESKSNCHLLRKQLDSKRSIATRMWAVFALTAMSDTAVEPIFNTICELEDLGDTHLMGNMLRLDKSKLSNIALKNLDSGPWKRKIISAQVLGISSNNRISINALKRCVQKWPPEYKGYAITALSYMNADSLENTLRLYLKPDSMYNLDKASYSALANSPTISDQYLLLGEIGYPSKITNDGLNLLLNSSQRRLVEIWYDYVTKNEVPDDYYALYNYFQKFNNNNHLREIVLLKMPPKTNSRSINELFKRILID